MTGPYRIKAHNFREIANLRTKTGARLRPGILFRSGDLSRVTAECVDEMKSLGIRSVIDLRSRSERRTHPYLWLDKIDSIAWGDAAERTDAEVAELMRRAETTDEVVQSMQQLYRTLPFSHAESYGMLFRRVADGDVPILFGCAAGKDRTGVAAALLLWSIGIEDTDIIADYVKTNECFDELKLLVEERFGLPVSAPVAIAMRADERFLEAAIGEVIARCGGIGRYVYEVLGMPSDRLDAIKTRLIS